jgi:hypothetical protein
MTLICPECGRRVGANQYARRGNRCGAWVISRLAEIRRTEAGIAWIPQRTVACAGILRKSYIGAIRWTA